VFIRGATRGAPGGETEFMKEQVGGRLDQGCFHSEDFGEQNLVHVAQALD